MRKASRKILINLFSLIMALLILLITGLIIEYQTREDTREIKIIELNY